MTYDRLNTYTVWQHMGHIELSQMEKVKLMNRTDTKFMANEQLLFPLLNAIAGNYLVQMIGNKPVARYDTLYYDTTEMNLYLMHHNRRLCRQKVRTRTYVDSGNLSFLEIKNKNNKGRTKKRRMTISRSDFFDFTGNKEAKEFENERGFYRSDQLKPQLRTRFDRVTLVNTDRTERLTIDLNLSFENIQTGRSASLDGLMVIELKQDGLCPSLSREEMLRLRIQPQSMSKYCIGTVLTNPTIKANRFKKKLRRIDKIRAI